jgi:cysteine protease ATG4
MNGGTESSKNVESCTLLASPHCIAEVGDTVAVDDGEILQTFSNYFSPPDESRFGAEEEGMQELEDRTGRDPITHILPNGGPDLPGGFDACNEYGYKYAYSLDDGDDDDGDENGHQGVPILPLDVSTVANTLAGSASLQELGYVTYLLGKTYDAVRDYAPRRSDENSLFWFTYRFDFPEIVPYRITTDAGWGCMLRSAQMMLGQALRMHYKGRAWRPPQAIIQRRHDSFMIKLMTWFADYPSKTECVFSLHNMVAAGLAKYETLPGEWYGPSKASYVMRDLCNMYAERQAKEESKGNSDMNRPIFRVHVASQGTVYRDAVNDLMTKDQQKDKERQSSELEAPNEPLSHPLDPIYSENTTKQSSKQSSPWDTSLLLLVPLRLGLQNFNQVYTVQLAHVFSFRQSVGVLGGRPRGARWFFGATSDGSKLYGLDPHTIQSCPERRRVKLPKGQTKQVVSLTAGYLRSVHTTSPECINLNRLDPSLALGFYCRDRNDFNHLSDALQKWKENHPKMPDIFTVAEHVPDYSASVSSAMNEMMSMSVADALDDTENDEAGDDEDEYVLL